MSTSELDSRNIAISMRKSVENLVISSQDAIGQSISQALTFSGVIAQHNQVIQETKNVSRSPSPSLRNSDGTDIIDNDRDFFSGNLIEASLLQGSEMAIQAGGAGDAVSLASVGDVIAGALPRADNPKGSTPNPQRSSEVRTKKKSWYTSLYPTYKSKSDDFKRLFKDLPDDERLIVDYSCALQKDILAHGRLYASQNYLCFYASIFGWETSLSLKWKEVTAITKEKTALVIPNAILVCTDTEKNFLTSFSGRDKAYLMLFRIWQNALMDQPMTSQEIWQWVHSCYGEELGFNSDDEGYGRDLASEVVPIVTESASELDLAESSMEGADRDSGRSVRGRDSSPPRVTNGGGVGRGRSEGDGDGEADTLPTDMSDTSDSEDKHPEAEKCTTPHEGRCVLKQQFPFNIDTLFTMMFTSSKFSLELLAERRTRDYVQAPWQQAGGLKCRQVSYVLGLTTGPIGPKEVHVTETQVMNKCSKPGALYSIDATSENAGIPYADYFTVEVHYCLTRCAEHRTDLAIYTHVNYKKSLWPMVKTFLEKNAISGMEDYARILEAHITAEAGSAAPLARAKRKQRRPIASSQEAAVSTAAKVPLAPVTLRARPAAGSHWTAATALLLLLLLNAVLYYRLYHPPHQHHHHQHQAHKMEGVSSAQMSEWSALLAAHTQRHRGELLAWRDALDHTVQHLHQTEQALRKLLETIEPSLIKAQDEAESDTIPETPKETPDPPGDSDRNKPPEKPREDL